MSETNNYVMVHFVAQPSEIILTCFFLGALAFILIMTWRSK